jgi:hypothetical protein
MFHQRFSRTSPGKVGRIPKRLSGTAVVAVALATTFAQARDMGAAVEVQVFQDALDHIVLDYHLADFNVQSVVIDTVEYKHITLGCESPIKIKGAPELPNVRRSLIIPDGAEVLLTVLASEFYEIQDLNVAPSKGILLRTTNPVDVPYTFGKAYETDAFYPRDLAHLCEPYTLRDHRGVIVQLNPFQYNPVTRVLRVYTEVTLELTAKVLPEPTPLRRELSSMFDQIYARHFLNYGPDLRLGPVGGVGDMLIICHDPWLPNVQPLVDHRNATGIPTTAVGVSTIGNNASDIQNYIQAVFDSSNLVFVLLVGDAAEVATPGDGQDPTYAKVAGADDIPDLFIGRFSAQTPDQLDTQVQRTIEYETMPAPAQDWYWRATGIASDQGPGDDGEMDWEHLDNIRLDLLAYGYDPVDQIYDPGATAGQVTAVVNAGRGLINYTGHGAVDHWSTTGFDNTDVSQLLNDNRLPFVFSVACQVGNFAGHTCFAEAWLRATNATEPTGAVATYMSAIDQSWSPPMCAQDEFIDLLVSAAPLSFGALCFAGSIQMIGEYGDDGVDMFDTWHVFGDPSLSIVPPANFLPQAVCISDTLTPEPDQNCCAVVTVDDIDGGSFDPDGPDDISVICITAVDGVAVDCLPEVEVCDAGAHTVQLMIADLAGASDFCDANIEIQDNTPPTITCSATGGAVDENCEFLVTFEAGVSDNCCVGPDDVAVDLTVLAGNATLAAPTINKTPVSEKQVSVTGSVLVSDLTSCPADVQITVNADDCAANSAETRAAVAPVVDEIPPELTCPADAVFEHGNFFCHGGEVLEWLDSATATDNCDPDVQIAHDAPPCGFPPDSTTEVTWTATDDCDNIDQCTATVTIPPPDTGQPGVKGSLLVYPNVELRWDDSYNLIQDTFITLTNTYNADVHVRMYFVSEMCLAIGNGIRLTQNEPAYWSARTGLPRGLSPFTILGWYPDPEGGDGPVLRGYIVVWAVDHNGREIRWNHLTGGATVVNYETHSAWEYSAWAFRTDCVGHGEELLDCLEFDESGTCCDPNVIPGNIDFDGFQYDMAPARLLFEFIAAESQTFSTTGYPLTHDTDLTLYFVDQDLRQENNGPASTNVEFSIWNANEVSFGGLTRCITCWDQRLLTLYGSHFLRDYLQTDVGRARLDGRAHSQCAGSTDAALLGVANQVLSFDDGRVVLAGRALAQSRRETAHLQFDLPQPPEEAHGGPQVFLLRRAGVNDPQGPATP